MSRRGRRAALPPGGATTARGRLETVPERLVVRCFSQDGQNHCDYDFSGLSMAEELRQALVMAFVARTAPGAGLTSLESTDKVHRVIVLFDRYLATLQWPPRTAEQVAPEHLDGFHTSRAHLGSAAHEFAELANLLSRVEGISPALAGRLAGPRPKRPKWENRQSYSRAEFTRIADTARADLRAAARRIREHRDLLDRFRAGDLHPEADSPLARKLELLERVDRLADVPRNVRKSGRTAGQQIPQEWVLREFGPVRHVVSWLHLTQPELAAGAVLLATMTGENPEVIAQVPAAHHRADGYTGERGTAIVELRKPRRGRRAYMTLALSEVPDWISVPEDPSSITARDELHTPFGLYLLLHELTARSRTLVGGNRLLVGYSETGGTGRGLRALPDNCSLAVTRLGQAHALPADRADEDGNPVVLSWRLDLLRLTYIELHQRPVAHTRQTAARTYLARNRGNITEYRQVVADALTAEVDKARARGAVAVMSAADVERACTDPVAVAAEHGLEPTTLTRMIDGELDTVLAACGDNKNGPHAPPGHPCPASFMLCLECECARALPRHLPVQVETYDRLTERREQMDPLRWATRFAGPHTRLTDLLAGHDEMAVADARQRVTDVDRALVDRFLARELDQR